VKLVVVNRIVFVLSESPITTEWFDIFLHLTNCHCWISAGESTRSGSSQNDPIQRSFDTFYYTFNRLVLAKRGFMCTI